MRAGVGGVGDSMLGKVGGDLRVVHFLHAALAAQARQLGVVGGFCFASKPRISADESSLSFRSEAISEGVNSRECPEVEGLAVGEGFDGLGNSMRGK
jgi:hypothetical protein